MVIPVTLVTNGEGVWSHIVDLVSRGMMREVHKTESLKLTALQGWTETGQTAIIVETTLQDGTVVFAQTTLDLFLAAADELRSKFPNG